MLTVKYGSPAQCREEFDASYHLDDGAKLYALKERRCHYQTIFESSCGDLELQIEFDKHVGPVTLLFYRDKINAEIAQSVAMDDL